MKGQSVHPAVAVLIVVIIIGVIGYLFTSVFTGQRAGSVGAPGAANSKQ